MTYKKVQDKYYEQYGKTVKTCWIAHVKRTHGATKGPAPNRGQGEATNLCPDNIFPRLEKIMKKCNMI